MAEKEKTKTPEVIPAEAQGVDKKVSTPGGDTGQLYVVLATKMGADYHRGDIVELLELDKDTINYLGRTGAIRRARASDFETEEDDFFADPAIENEV